MLIDDEGVIKLTDPGFFKKMIMKEENVMLIGSERYTAPELIKGEPLTYKIDIW